jgi:RNA polymerase sigma factor (sigma-70 family)
MVADGELVDRAVAGDRQAAADLIDRHAAGVYAVCLGLLADPDQAQDVSQETLLKGISRLASLRRPAAFRGWLIAIAHNLCRDAWQQTRRHRELLARQIAAASAFAGAEPDTVPGLGTGGAASEPADDEPDLREALARLPEAYRLPLLLYYFDGLSTCRVADALNISPAAAATRLCRARRALRKILEVDHG